MCIYLVLYCIYIYVFAAPVCDWNGGEHLDWAIRGGSAQFMRDSEVSRRSDSVSIYVTSYLYLSTVYVAWSTFSYPLSWCAESWTTTHETHETPVGTYEEDMMSGWAYIMYVEHMF